MKNLNLMRRFRMPTQTLNVQYTLQLSIKNGQPVDIIEQSPEYTLYRILVRFVDAAHKINTIKPIVVRRNTAQNIYKCERYLLYSHSAIETQIFDIIDSMLSDMTMIDDGISIKLFTRDVVKLPKGAPL